MDSMRSRPVPILLRHGTRTGNRTLGKCLEGAYVTTTPHAPQHTNIARQRSVSPDRFVDIVRPTLMRLAECTATLRSADLAVFDARNKLRTAASELMRWMRIMDHEIDPNEPDPDSDIDVEVYLAGTGAKKGLLPRPPGRRRHPRSRPGGRPLTFGPVRRAMSVDSCAPSRHDVPRTFVLVGL